MGLKLHGIILILTNILEYTRNTRRLILELCCKTWIEPSVEIKLNLVGNKLDTFPLYAKYELDHILFSARF